MATSNFANENASKVFAVELEDEFAYDDLKDCLEYELDEAGFEVYKKPEYDHNRNYSGQILAEKRLSHSYKDFTVTATIFVVVRSGYYSGANLDWQITFCDDFEHYEHDDYDPKYTAEDLVYRLDFPPSKAKTYSLLAEKKYEKLKDQLVTELEAIYAKISTPLVVAARFSNGETIYEKA
jgi:hypothetical protein